MDDEKWYSLSEASIKQGRSRAYFSSIKANHPEYFENVELKKVGDRLRILPLKAVYKTKHILCFYPTNHYIKIAIN